MTRLTPRRFGVEIECFGGGADSTFRLLESNGITASRVGYNNSNYDDVTWKTTTDGSLGSYANAVEIVSPILTVDRFDEIRKVGKILKDHGYYIRASCGLHVHIDATDLTAGQVAFVAIRYRNFARFFDNMMAENRRRNRYCTNMRPAEFTNYNQLLNSEAIERTHDRSYGLDTDKFRKVNLRSWINKGTIEFRQHHGTIDAEEIIGWVSLLQSFVSSSLALYEETVKNAPPVSEVTEETVIEKSAALNALLGMLQPNNDFEYGRHNFQFSKDQVFDALRLIDPEIKEYKLKRLARALVNEVKENYRIRRVHFSRGNPYYYCYSHRYNVRYTRFPEVRKVNYRERKSLENFTRGFDALATNYVNNRLGEIADAA